MDNNDIKKTARDRAKEMRRIRLARDKAVFMKFGAKIRAYFFTGILVSAPVAITIYIAYGIMKFVDLAVRDLIPRRFYDVLPFIPGIGIIVLVASMILVGWFAAGFLGSFFLRLGEWVVYKVPLISSMYSLLKQVFETFFSGKNQSFNKVVLLEYPRKGIWVYGFVSGMTRGEAVEKTKEELVSVFVPTTPNPTSGFLIFVPKQDLIFVEMSVEDALKLIVSCGLVYPDDQAKPEELD